MYRVVLTLLAVIAIGLVAGCSGGGGLDGGGSTPTEEIISSALMQIGTTASENLQKIEIPVHASDPLAGEVNSFVGVFGARITRFSEIRPGKVVYASSRDGDFDIYTMNADGTGRRMLTANTGYDGEPRWSPDGTKIVFSSDRSGNREIWVMNADGTNPQQLTTDPAADRQPVWSPDNQRIAFVSERDGNAEVYLMNTNGSNLVNISRVDGVDDQPCFSPDGQFVAYRTLRSGNGDIIVHPVYSGSAPMNLTPNPDPQTNPCWGPDGLILYTVRVSDTEYWFEQVDTGGSVRNSFSIEGVTRDPVRLAAGGGLLYTGAGGGLYLQKAPWGWGEQNRLTQTSIDTDPDSLTLPTAFRTYIGPNGTDGGANPPFGTARGAVIAAVGLDAIANIVSVETPNMDSLKIAALDAGSASLAVADITGTDLRAILELNGRGLAPRAWDVSGSPATGSATVYFNGRTGKIVTILATSDSSFTPASAAMATAAAGSGEIVLNGAYDVVLDQRDPKTNRVRSRVNRVVLDATTGEVVSAQ